MAPQQTHQRLGNHPDLCFRGKVEIQLSHSHHDLEQQHRMGGNNQKCNDRNTKNVFER